MAEHLSYSRRKAITLATMLLAILGSGLATSSVHAASTQSCTNVPEYIADADTIWLQCSSGRVKVRFAQIDAPEVPHTAHGKMGGQAYGVEAANDLKQLISGQQVTVKWSQTDHYGRVIGTVYIGDTDVNAWLVSRGDAWVYDRYAHDPHMKQLEAQAKAQHLGLWAQANPMPPWQWRHSH